MIKKFIIFSLMAAFSLEAQVVYRSPEPVAPEVCVGDICAISEPDEPALPIDLDAEEVEVIEPIRATRVVEPVQVKTKPILIPKKIKTFAGKIVKPAPTVEAEKIIVNNHPTQSIEVSETVVQPEVEITQEVPAETIITTPETDILSTQDDLEDPVKIPDDQDIQVL